MRPSKSAPMGGTASSRRVGVLVLVGLCAFITLSSTFIFLVAHQRGLSKDVVELQAGAAGHETLAELEHQKARLKKFITGGAPQTGPAVHTSTEEVKGEVRQPEAENVIERPSSKRHCGKLCQTRKMLLRARSRIDSQAHLELQQLAVSPYLTAHCQPVANLTSKAALTHCFSVQCLQHACH